MFVFLVMLPCPAARWPKFARAFFGIGGLIGQTGHTGHTGQTGRTGRTRHISVSLRPTGLPLWSFWGGGVFKNARERHPIQARPIHFHLKSTCHKEGPAW